MNFPNNIAVNDDIRLELFNINHKKDYFESIHELKDNDDYRNNLQGRFSNLKKVELMLIDAIDDKLQNTGSPDYFIIYKGKIAGIFEFHPLNEGDYVEIGYWLFAKFRRLGVLSQIIPVMIDFSKEYFDKSKILATTPIDNISSQRLLRKMKFIKTENILEFTNSRTGIVSKEFEYYYNLVSL